jgi:hypothetical protein
MRAAWWLVAVAAISAGCAAVLGIPNDSPSFCAQPANQGHTYCEDFDVGDPSSRWTFAENVSGGVSSISPSDRSPPNLLDMSVPGVPEGGSALAGFDKEFDDRTFTGLHIEADVRFVTQGGAPITANGGFMLITDKGGGCIGIGLGSGNPPGARAGIGTAVFPVATACSALTGAAVGPAGPPTQTFLMEAPQPNSWFHVVVDVAPIGFDGRGRLDFNIVGLPSSAPPVDLAPGVLVPSGIPLVGFAAEVNGGGTGSGPLEVQYDNITIDVTGS